MDNAATETPTPAPTPKHSPAKLGLIAGIIAYCMWGVYPFYFKAIQDVSPLEILAHRVVWSVPFGALIITFRKQWKDVLVALRNNKTLLLLVIGSIFLSVNWGLYIWAVNNEQIFQASLGYYINPLIFVMVGVVFLEEKLNKFQVFAVTLAAIGVAILTIYGGQFPWIALVLASSFSIYGVIRKQLDVGAMPGLFIETLALFLPALAYLAWLSASSGAKFFAGDGSIDILLILAGPITVLPLLAFAFSARRLALSTLGFLQFIGPTGQFLCALYFGETLTTAHLICFSFIWLAVIFFIIGALHSSNAARRNARATALLR